YPFGGVVNIPPVANAGPNQNLPAGTTSTTLSGSGTDADGTVVGYAWTQTAGPTAGVTINPTTSATTGTTQVSGLTNGNTYTFKLTVTDNLGATGSSTVNVTVNSPGTVWLTTGNAGMIDGTNFIGTTDNVPFNIRVNNTPSGRIDPIIQNTFYGYGSGIANTTGNSNVSIGYQALYFNTTGSWNTAIGFEALASN